MTELLVASTCDGYPNIYPLEQSLVYYPMNALRSNFDETLSVLPVSTCRVVPVIPLPKSIDYIDLGTPLPLGFCAKH